MEEYAAADNQTTRDDQGNVKFFDADAPAVNDFEAVTKALKEDKKSGLQYMSMFAEKQFFDQRYASRTCNITTEYSPDRLIGFPALVMDKILPAVYGTISSINTSISADGTNRQDITISSPKLLTIPIGDTPESYEVLVNTIPQFPKVFDNASYGTKVIGKGFYNKIMGLDNGVDGSSSSILTDDEKEEVTEITSVLLLTIKRLSRMLESESAAKKELDPKRRRRLVTEEEFWTFIQRSGDQKDTYKVSDIIKTFKKAKTEAPSVSDLNTASATQPTLRTDPSDMDTGREPDPAEPEFLFTTPNNPPEPEPEPEPAPPEDTAGRTPIVKFVLKKPKPFVEERRNRVKIAIASSGDVYSV